MKIKNGESSRKIPKFTLQTYAFAFQRLMDFPHGRFDYVTLATLNFFESELSNIKIIELSILKYTYVILT